jgi:hypothetical protein
VHTYEALSINANGSELVIQSEHKVFLQTFIARKLRGIQTYFFFSKCNSTQKKFLETNGLKKMFVFHVVF